MTNDEDHRQELWLRYLEGASLSSLEKTLNKIKIDEDQAERIKSAVWSILNDPPSEKLSQILERFTPFEQKVMLMLALGCDISHISVYNEISQVRLCQLIGNIRDSKEWERVYGAEEKLNRS